ncbi:hypothetical protein BC834DRAFT_1042708 [Gloeopeniophorella convolvens]|nr:hypothetical protein BC834DRAFT_1042708 [Gloeopeniophorella convolvens]
MRNTLAIALTESVLVLRPARRPDAASEHAPPSILRGLLTLDLVKPTRVASIDLELVGQSTTTWPEGSGARVTQMQEETTLFSATQTFFRAPAARRALSVDPGLVYYADEHDAGPPPPERGRERVRRRLSADSAAVQPAPPAAVRARSPTPLPPTPPDDLPAAAVFPAPPPTPHAPDGGYESRSLFHPPSLPASRAPSLAPPTPTATAPPSRRVSFDTSREGSPAPAPSPAPRHRSPSRGRARFSLASVSSSILEAVRSVSGSGASVERGRPPRADNPTTLRTATSTPRPATGGRSSKRVRTYTFPISFAIPAHMPPTLHCAYGAVTWRLKAAVHRPGAFTPRLAAARDVLLVAADDAADDDTAPPPAVARVWDDQLQYALALGARAVPLGGALPLSLTLLPLAKAKVHRISVQLENASTTTSTRSRRTAATRARASRSSSSPPPRPPPRSSRSRSSPPPPRTPPAACGVLHASHRAARAPLRVAHTLRVVLRVERGDDAHVDARTGRRKLFDIVVRAPVCVLSPLSGTAHTVLPSYSEALEPLCATCGAAQHPPAHPHAKPHAHEAQHDDLGALYDRSATFERLITGQLGEVGDAPPAYSA